MGSAYLYGLAQASLEINAIQGILMAAFIFVPLYLKDKVVTITQFIQRRLGRRVALFYSIANIILFSTITLGAALFWGAYAADLVFADYLTFIHENRIKRIAILIVGLGIFSAIYTYLRYYSVCYSAIGRLCSFIYIDSSPWWLVTALRQNTGVDAPAFARDT